MKFDEYSKNAIKGMDFLERIMFHIRSTHCTMAGNHRYALNQSGYPLVREIKAWLSEIDETERGD